MFVGLVHDPGWAPDDDPTPAPPRRAAGQGWWRPLAWWAAWCWLFVLAGLAANAIGAVVGYLVVLLAVALASWRLERWCARQYWGGLREWRG